MIRAGLGGGGVSSYAIALEAWRRGLTVTFRSPLLEFYSVSDAHRRVDFNFALPTSITPQATKRLLDRKHETNSLLAKDNVRTPRGHLLDPATLSHAELARRADEVGYPVVLKPNRGSTGTGVVTSIGNPADLARSYDHIVSTLNPAHILLEEHIEGDDYRVLVVGHKVVGVARRVPANVIGDGRSSIRDLISVKNEKRKRNPFLASGLIRVDFEVENLLEDQSFDLDQVPEVGRRVVLRRVANASAGGDVEDVTEAFPEVIKRAAVQAAHAVPGVVTAGVDILYDPARPAITENYAVVEINPRPHIGVNMYPTKGIGRDAPRAIIDALFPGVTAIGAGAMEVRFNEHAVKRALRNGTAAELTLAPIPANGRMHCSRAVFAGWSRSHPGRRFPAATLQRRAQEMGVSGTAEVTKSGDVHVRVASKGPRTTEQFLSMISEVLDLEAPSQRRWEGPVTLGFTVSE